MATLSFSLFGNRACYATFEDITGISIYNKSGPSTLTLAMPKHRLFTTPFSNVYPLYVAKAERKKRTQGEVDRVICGVRIEEIDDPLMKEIRYLDKLVDDLAKGRSLEKILPD